MNVSKPGKSSALMLAAHQSWWLSQMIAGTLISFCSSESSIGQTRLSMIAKGTHGSELEIKSTNFRKRNVAN